MLRRRTNPARTGDNARMHIQLNGEARDIAPGTTLVQLLEAEGLAHRRVAVEINGEIVPRSQYSERIIAEGDRLEIVHAIGGG